MWEVRIDICEFFLAVYILAILLCALGDLACKNQLQLDENYSDL